MAHKSHKFKPESHMLALAPIKQTNLLSKKQSIKSVEDSKTTKQLQLNQSVSLEAHSFASNLIKLLNDVTSTTFQESTGSKILTAAHKMPQVGRRKKAKKYWIQSKMPEEYHSYTISELGDISFLERYNTTILKKK